MVQFAVVFETADVEQAADRLLQVGVSRLKSASRKAVNEVTDRTFDDAVGRMTSRVNITRARVEKDMGVERAEVGDVVEGKIIAFRRGGRRSDVKPVNIRQYAAVQQMKPVRFGNENATGPLRDWKGRTAAQWLKNPRKPGGKLPFILRTGAPDIGVPLGQKQAGVSVEVLKGTRKTIQYAFFAKARNAGMLVFKREKGDKKGKGKMVSVNSLSVWQLFRKTSADIVPLVREDLTKTILKNLDDELREVL